MIFAYGPVMLNEALVASELLEKENFSLKVVNMPWLNRVDCTWLEQLVAPFPAIYVVDDHSPVGQDSTLPRALLS